MNELLFPPFMPAKQDAFLISEDGKIYFNISTLNSISQIKHIQVALNRQDNNRNVLPTSGTTWNNSTRCINYALGLVFYKKEGILFDSQKQMYYIRLPKVFTKEVFYKVQIRFGIDDITFTSGKVYIGQTPVDSAWVQVESNLKRLSEWSTVGIFKTIEAFDIEIQSLPKTGVTPMQTTVYTFVGLNYISFKNPTETIVAYEFNLLTNNKIIESSGRKTEPANQRQFHSHTFRTVFIPSTTYTVQFIIYTKHGYKAITESQFKCTANDTAPTYEIKVIKEPSHFLNSAQLEMKDAGVTLAISDTYYELEEDKPNAYIVRRTDSRSNFEDWVEICETKSFPGPGDYYREVFDNFVESGITYKYAVQAIMLNSGRGLVSKSVSITPDYNYSWLIGQNDVCLKISFNMGISGYKTVIKESMIETIGSKYPFFVRNGDLKYRQFSLSGLITRHMDVEGTLVKIDKNEEYVMEREFRNALESLLLDGKPKVIKTDTEGLMIVYLSNVSLNPENSLGRRLYSFSCQVTEIADYNVENLIKYDLLDYNIDRDRPNLRYPAIAGYVKENNQVINASDNIVSGVI